MIVRIFGGLGNQLFCYAFARTLKLKFIKCKVSLDIKNGFKNDKQYLRKYKLGNLASNFDNSLISIINFLIKPYFIKKIESLFFLIKDYPILKRFIVKIYTFDFDNKFNLKGDIIKSRIFIGYWQNKQIFYNYKSIIFSEIIDEFRIKKTKDDFKDIFLENKSKKYIAVHVRSKSLDELCSYEYYKNALNEIEKKYGNNNYKVLIFSDGMNSSDELIKKICVGENYLKLSFNDIDDFRIMASCDGLIISRSTYSLWAGYLMHFLNTDSGIFYPDDFVFAPTQNLIMEDWIKI